MTRLVNGGYSAPARLPSYKTFDAALKAQDMAFRQYGANGHLNYKSAALFAHIESEIIRLYPKARPVDYGALDQF